MVPAACADAPDAAKGTEAFEFTWCRKKARRHQQQGFIGGDDKTIREKQRWWNKSVPTVTPAKVQKARVLAGSVVDRRRRIPPVEPYFNGVVARLKPHATDVHALAAGV